MPRYPSKKNPMTADLMPPIARQTWEYFLTAILPHWQQDETDRFIRHIQEQFPVYGIEKPRAIGRIEDWLTGDSIPCGPIAVTILVFAIQFGYLTPAQLEILFGMKAGEPKQDNTTPTNTP